MNTPLSGDGAGSDGSIKITQGQRNTSGRLARALAIGAAVLCAGFLVFSGSRAQEASSAGGYKLNFPTNSLTHSEVKKSGREFRVRQYLNGYKERGNRVEECDKQSIQFIGNWIAGNYGGPSDTNAPDQRVLSEQLA
ncbi:MAG: hypothetical protein ACK4UN_19985, partial [Limisphaerales bacterium]